MIRAAYQDRSTPAIVTREDLVAAATEIEQQWAASWIFPSRPPTQSQSLCCRSARESAVAASGPCVTAPGRYHGIHRSPGQNRQAIAEADFRFTPGCSARPTQREHRYTSRTAPSGSFRWAPRTHSESQSARSHDKLPYIIRLDNLSDGNDHPEIESACVRCRVRLRIFPDINKYSEKIYPNTPE
jgi:hypothetical protein